MVLNDDRVTSAPAPTRPEGSRRRRLVLIGLAAVAVLLLAGILTVILVPGKPARPPRPPAVPPAGIATVTAQTGVPGFVVAFHDAGTGRVTRTVTVPTAGLTGPDLRRRFNADFTLLAWATADGLHIAHLTADGYAETAVWKPETNYQYGDIYADAVVNPATGRVWFQQTRTAGNARLIQIVSIDPAVAGDKPRVEPVTDLPPTFDRTGAPATSRPTPLTNDPTARADLVATDAEVLAGSVTLPGGARYECPAALAADALACYAADSAPFGAVAKLQLDRAAKTATMGPVLATVDAPVQGLLVSPDRAQLRLRTAAGWLAVPAAGAGGAQPTKLDPPADTPLAWL